MTGQRVAFYDYQGECCRYGVWWVPVPWVARLGSRTFAHTSTRKGWAIYEEVWG
jgi:hypothetical protein